MSLLFTNTQIEKLVQNYFTQQEVNEVMHSVNIVLNAQNKVIIRNQGSIKSVKIVMDSATTQQIVLDVIRDFNNKFDKSQELSDKIDAINDNNGLASTTIINKQLSTKLLSYTDQTTINSIKAKVREEFNLGNLVEIVNDELLPTSSLENLDVSLTNKNYNETLTTEFTKLLNEYLEKTKAGTDLKEKNTNKSGLNLNEMVNALAAALIPVAIAVSIAGIGYLVFRFKKDDKKK